MGAVAEPPATIACSSRGGLSQTLEVIGVSEMRLDWGGVRTLDGVGLDPGLVEAVVSARDMEQGHRDLMLLEDVVYYIRCLSEAALLVTSELVEAVCTGRCTVPCGLTMATDALYEISLGQTASSETALGSTGVADRCRDINPRQPPPPLPDRPERHRRLHPGKLRDHHGSDRPRREPLEHLHPDTPRPRPRGTDREGDPTPSI